MAMLRFCRFKTEHDVVEQEEDVVMVHQLKDGDGDSNKTSLKVIKRLSVVKSAAIVNDDEDTIEGSGDF